MPIKSFVFHFVKQASSFSSAPVTRSHAYELLAAASGYHSYAAFTQTSIWSFGFRTLHDINFDAVITRYQTLGYSGSTTEIAQLIQKLMREYVAHPISIIDLIKELNYGEPSEDREKLIACLEAQNNKNGLIHYALGKLLTLPDEYGEQPNSYWYQQLRTGKTLDETQNAFANEYQIYLDERNKAQQHFRTAAEYGCALGLLGLAVHFENPQFFNARISADDLPNGTYDPLEVALLGQEMGYETEYTQWLFSACGQGNIEAIKAAVDDLDNNNPLLSHTLAELSALLGSDIREGSYFAVDEHGNETDGDHHGPMYAAGYDGAELPQIPDEDLATAKAVAARWHKEIQETGKSRCLIG